ncbi:DUF4116 domain-containing protein [Parachlamydia sp. AcF125]|uniref:DUF4116 domain-containing protein n=1 Tax=Parachlamydia sp. AcF125 TaxID=2795736 RepID=UPI001BC9A516|nr:DUF4116 domain-containing protein [Parachlamydia sp. AcF125]
MIKKIVLMAVKQEGLVLQHASQKLRKDREVVAAAILQNELASKKGNTAMLST